MNQNSAGFRYSLRPAERGQEEPGAGGIGPLVAGSANIISRNLTPDKTGLPFGGDTFEEFRQIMRTGVDFDHLHPTCQGFPTQPVFRLR